MQMRAKWPEKQRRSANVVILFKPCHICLVVHIATASAVYSTRPYVTLVSVTQSGDFGNNPGVGSKVIIYLQIVTPLRVLLLPLPLKYLHQPLQIYLLHFFLVLPLLICLLPLRQLQQFPQQFLQQMRLSLPTCLFPLPIRPSLLQTLFCLLPFQILLQICLFLHLSHLFPRLFHSWPRLNRLQLRLIHRWLLLSHLCLHQIQLHLPRIEHLPLLQILPLLLRTRRCLLAIHQPFLEIHRHPPLIYLRLQFLLNRQLSPQTFRLICHLRLFLCLCYRRLQPCQTLCCHHRQLPLNLRQSRPQIRLSVLSPLHFL